MPRYFLHLRHLNEVLTDAEGVEVAESAVEGLAVAAARDCMAGDVAAGILDLRYAIQVCDDSGAVVCCLNFADALEVIQSDAAD